MGGGGPSLSQKARVPFTQMFQLRLPFEKGAPFQHFFFSFFGCEILITMHSLNWWNQNYMGAPTTRSEGEKIHICKIGWAAQIVRFKTHTRKKQQQQQLQGAPSLKCSSYDYPFKKVPLSNTFFIVWLQNSHNDYDAFQKLMKSELFGCLFN